MALIPGVSRSGGTITAGLFLGYSRSAAARYSFLLAIPAVLGSGFFQAYEALTGDVAGRAWPGGRRSWRRSRVRRRPHRHRLAAPLPRPRQLHAVRRLPHRARGAGPRPRADGCPRPHLSPVSPGRPLGSASWPPSFSCGTAGRPPTPPASWPAGPRGAARRRRRGTGGRGGGAAGEGAPGRGRQQPAGALPADRGRRRRRPGPHRADRRPARRGPLRRLDRPHASRS